jgi:hypothetical protein
MFNKKELSWIVITIIISAFIFSLHKNPSEIPTNIFFGVIIFSIIILTNTISKKLASGNYSINIEYDIWTFQRYNFPEKSKLKKPFPIGLVLPFFLAFISLGYIECFTFLQYNYENMPKKRLLKQRGLTRKTEINEGDLAATSAWGFVSLLVLAIITSIIHFNFPDLFIFGEIAKYSIVYGIWNLLPISNLDGTRLFFGSFIGWFFLGVIYLISLGLVVIFI